MEDTLQSSQEQTEPVINGEGAASEVASQPEGSENREGQQPGELTPNAQEAINKQHGKFKTEERKNVELTRKLEEQSAKLAQFEAAKPAPVIPAMPDPFDDDFDAKMAARDQAITEKARFDGEQAAQASQQQAVQQQTAREQQQALQETVTKFNAAATTQGFNQAELEQAGSVVASYGITPDLARFLLDRSDGPAVTTYLAQNPVELDAVARMSPLSAAVHIQSVIAEKAKALIPQPSSAPPPVETLGGGGVPPRQHPAVANTTFE
jgi:hypothetical protein